MCVHILFFVKYCIVSVRKNIYLLDIAAQNEIIGNKLLSRQQTLIFFYQVHIFKKSKMDSAAVTVNALKSFWEKARILISCDDHVTESFLRFYAK